MRLYCLSDNPNKPCSVLQFKNVKLMLDCGLDLSSLLHYLPIPLVPNQKIENLPAYHMRDNAEQGEGELRDANGRVVVDSTPEFVGPQDDMVDLREIDAILISNYTCMLALPYITEHLGFRGVVYATEPTKLFGNLLMEEMIEYLDRTPKERKSARWKSIIKHLPPPLGEFTDAKFLKSLYTKEMLSACMSRVQLMGYNEKKDIFGLLTVSPVSSGFCLGSSNWIIQSGFEKIVYLSGSSTLTTHPRTIDQSSIKGADCLIMTSLTQTPTQMPDPMIGDFCRLICDTLKNSGNVLVPCYPAGIIYDLFECLSQQMDICGLTTYPMFFISPVANSSLAYSNIMAEWLSQAKHNRVFLPEEPFVHGGLMRSARLRAFKSLQDESVHTEYRQPCVVFCGHPSLRFGEVVHFVELWGSNPANLIVFTEPSFNYLEALAPFQPIQMKAVHCPIDTSLNFTQARKLIKEARPKRLVIPERYTQPPTGAPTRSDLVIDLDLPTHKYNKMDIIKIPVKRRLENITIHPDLAAKLVPCEVRPGVAVATITGHLNVKDNKYSLKVLEDSAEGKARKRDRSITPVPFPLSKQKPANYLYGKLNVNEFVQKLSAKGITDAKVESSASGSCIIHLLREETLIQIDDNETHVVCDQIEGTPASERERLRETLKQIILTCISKF